MQELDAVSFAIPRHMDHFHRRAYRPQLRRLLHDGLYSRHASETAEPACEAEDAVVLARKASLKCQGLDQAYAGTGRAADRVVVAPNYRTIVSIQHPKHKQRLM